LPAPLKVFHPWVVERTYLPDPSGRTLGQFRMVYRLPRSGGFPQDFPLVTQLDLALCQFSQKRAAAPLADQLVDIGNDVDRKDYVCSTIRSLGHTPSVTYQPPSPFLGLRRIRVKNGLGGLRECFLEAKKERITVKLNANLVMQKFVRSFSDGTLLSAKRRQWDSTWS
jgi:hypothetical protein